MFCPDGGFDPYNDWPSKEYIRRFEIELDAFIGNDSFEDYSTVIKTIKGDGQTVLDNLQRFPARNEVYIADRAEGD